MKIEHWPSGVRCQ